MKMTNALSILASDNWQSLNARQFTLDQWIDLALKIRDRPHLNRAMLISRIQILVVEAGLISDDQYVKILTRK